MHGNILAMPLLLVSIGSPGENVAMLGTILPLKKCLCQILPKTTTIDLTKSCIHATYHKSRHYLTLMTVHDLVTGAAAWVSTASDVILDLFSQHKLLLSNYLLSQWNPRSNFYFLWILLHHCNATFLTLFSFSFFPLSSCSLLISLSGDEPTYHLIEGVIIGECGCRHWDVAAGRIIWIVAAVITQYTHRSNVITLWGAGPL